ncbi:hypothetical protein [Spirosoma areae]
MKTARSKLLLIPVAILASASLSFGQNANQAAVDTLTKDVAIAVFEKISQQKAQPKALEIYGLLLNCGDGCDPQTIIRTVGGWDPIGAKMQELSELKSTARFIALSPAEANAAIRKQLADFYARYKKDNNYGKPLSLAVQSQILAKIDGMLPPAATPDPALTASESPAASQPETVDETTIDPRNFQISQLEREITERKKKELWTMILSGLVGLLVGAGAVYLLAYRNANKKIQRLLAENLHINRTLEFAQRPPKPTNEPRQPPGDYRQKVSAYDAIVAELGTDNPLTTIQQLKQQSAGISAKPAPIVRSGEPVVEPGQWPEAEPVQEQANAVQMPDPLPAPARSEVFYFPPPDPNGQFDSAQRSGSLSPESAYRFSISADKPMVASFRFEAEPGRVARFLTYRNYMIEPACESENSYTPTHTRIAMRRDGEAVLENGVWRVKTKALIRYE